MHFSILLFILTILSGTSSVFTSGAYHPCTDKFTKLMLDKNLSRCQKLPTLGAELSWSQPSDGVVRVLFGAPMDEEEDGGWLAWGVNPGPQAEMVGTRAAIGIKNPYNGSLSCQAYNVTYETRLGCHLKPSPLEEVKCSSFYYDTLTQYHVIEATLNLSPKNYIVSRLNIVWQMGFDVDEDKPLRHAATLKNVDSVETLDLLSGKSSDMPHVKIYLRKVHGILNIIGWGTLLPVGAIIARFFRKFPFDSQNWWYGVHVGCQSVGYSIGVSGWGIGIWLAHNSPRYVFHTHHNLAVAIFVFATLQTLAIKFRPKPVDDFRRGWNIYHHFLGYALLGLIFMNIFEGIKILKVENKERWRIAVIGILIVLSLFTLILEVYTWFKFIRDKNLSKKAEVLLSHPSKPYEEEADGGGTIDLSPFARRNTLSTPELKHTLES